MEETLMNADRGETTKIKTHHARIVVDGTADNPYYSIEWFDPTKQENYLGYSSYYIENVFNWLLECFEIVETPKTHADRIRAMTDAELAWFMADRNVNESTVLLLNKDHGLTAVQIEAIKQNIYCALMQWLQQPAEGE